MKLSWMAGLGGVYQVAKQFKTLAIMLAVVGVSSLGLYLTHSLKQAGAATVERKMLLAVIERNESVARSREASLEASKRASSEANAQIQALRLLVRPDNAAPQDEVTECSSQCKYVLRSQS